MSGNKDKILVFEDPTALTTSTQPPTYTKPVDNFDHLPTSPTHIYYLAVTAPHTDTYTLYGPVSSFAALFPTINTLASDSPAGLEKLETLSTDDNGWGARIDNPAFETTGFHTLVLDGQRSTYTVLQVLAIDNAGVRALLPAPVYTVTRHGPLINTFSLVNTYTTGGATPAPGAAVGMAATSHFVGCFGERKEAVEAARQAMGELVDGVDGVAKSEVLGQGAEGGVLLAAKPGVRWEVRVRYREEVFGGAREVAQAEGKEVEWRF